MKRKIGRFVAIGLCFGMFLSAVSCKKAEQSEEENYLTETSYGQVWSAPSTVKIRQTDVDYAEKGEAVLSYQAVRNEYENAQLLITAKKDITRYELQTSDLKNGDEVLSGENFTVYVQKYVSFIDSYYGSNIMPDALIPMDAADEYAENTIFADANGALWVTVYVPKETKAGTYEGEFQLIIDGEDGEEKLNIPVSVQVYDYTLPDETDAKTVFTWTYDCLAVGEMDGSTKMMEAYYEFFLDYGISLQNLPLETLSGDEYVNALVKYWDQITTNTLMRDAGTLAGGMKNCKEQITEQVLAMAAASTTDRNLFEKSLIYSTDEPDIRNDAKREQVISDAKAIKEILQSCVDVIKADETDKYANFKKIENWEESIVDITQVQTFVEYSTDWLLENADTKEGQELLESMDSIFIKAIPEEDIIAIKELAAKYDIEVWWYTCNVPIAPAANYHIGNENLLSARTLSWYQAKYDIEGNLYWRAAAYVDNDADNEYNDVYSYPFYFKGCPAGDGFLVYPGAAYGIYGPLPSLRLMSIRDGMEEYDLLKAVEEKYKNIAELFGESFSVDRTMNTFYSALGTGIDNVYKDGENGLDFTALRTELLKTLTSFDADLIFAIGDIQTEDNVAVITYFASEDAVVTIQGEEQVPVEGVKYQYILDLTKETNLEVVLTNSKGQSVTYDRFIENPCYIMNSLDEEAVLQEIKVSDGGSAELISTDQYSTDGTSLHLKVQGTLTGNKLVDAAYKPSVSIATSLFGEIQPSDVSAITMDIYNPGEAFKTEIRLYSGEAYTGFGEFEIAPGMTTVTLGLKAEEFLQIESADRLAFEFANTDDNDNVLSYEFYLDNINGKQ